MSLKIAVGVFLIFACVLAATNAAGYYGYGHPQYGYGYDQSPAAVGHHQSGLRQGGLRQGGGLRQLSSLRQSGGLRQAGGLRQLGGLRQAGLRQPDLSKLNADSTNTGLINFLCLLFANCSS